MPRPNINPRAKGSRTLAKAKAYSATFPGTVWLPWDHATEERVGDGGHPSRETLLF